MPEISGRVIDRGDDLILPRLDLREIFLVDNALADEFLELAFGEDLPFDQGLGDSLQVIAASLEQMVGPFVGFAEDPRHFLVDYLRGVLGMIPQFGHLAPEEGMLLGGAEEDRTDAVAHAELRDHQPAEAGPASLQAPAFGKVVPQVAQPMPPAAESALSNAVRSSRAKAGKEAAQPLPQADEWLRRIIELRRAGRDAQADDELARFRAAFPKVPVPAEAL